MSNKTIKIQQGTGAEALEMTVQVTQEEFDKMEELRKQNPSEWLGRDFDLLLEVKKQIADEREAIKQKKSDVDIKTSNEYIEAEKMQEKKKRKYSKLIIWLVVLLLAVIAFIWLLPIIKMSSIKWGGIIKSQPQGVMKEEAGATFFLPNNWEYSIDTGAMYITISMKSTTEPAFFNILWEPSTYYSFTHHSSESEIKIFAEASKEKNQTTNVKQIPFNGCDGYIFATSLKVDNEKYYSAWLCYKINKETENERIIIMEKVAPDIKTLNSDVFKRIESSFKYSKPKERPQYQFKTEDLLPKLSELNLFFFDEITFQYPTDWDFEDISEGQSKCYIGSNKQESQVITYSWVNGTITMTAEEWLKKNCDNLKSEYNNVQFFEKKATTYNTYNALTRKFKCTYEGETYYGQVVCIVQEESACAILKYAETEQELASDAFKLMESTFIMPILPPKRLSK